MLMLKITEVRGVLRAVNERFEYFVELIIPRKVSVLLLQEGILHMLNRLRIILLIFMDRKLEKASKRI